MTYSFTDNPTESGVAQCDTDVLNEDIMYLRYTLLDTMYPVGSIYIGTMQTCPLATLGIGTWQLVAADRVLQGAGTRGNVGATISESLPNITGSFRSDALVNIVSGVCGYIDGGQKGAYSLNSDTWREGTITFDASRSSLTYQNNAPVQQDAYLVNIWERIS